MAVKVITDSTSYINSNIQKELDIKVLSLYVNFNDDSIKEIEISNEDFYKKMEAEGIPISSQPAVGEILVAMEEVLKAGDDLVCVFLSSKMSGTFQSAFLTKQYLLENYPEANIEIIDSKTNSMQLGFTAITAARLAKANKSFDEIVKEVNKVVESSRFIFIPENLDYLHKGGRIGGAGTLFGNMLKITPILTVKDGEANIFQTVRTKKRAKATLIKKLMEDHKKYKVLEVAVHHINAYDEAVQLQKDLEQELDVKSYISSIGPVIGVHVGPGAIGLAYHTEKKIED